MRIMYLVDKHPKHGEPKQGKYPAIFHEVSKRGHEVCMIVYSAEFRGDGNNKIPKLKESNYYYDGKSIIMLYKTHRYLNRLFLKYARVMGLENILKIILARVAIFGSYGLAKEYIKKHGLPDIIHAWGEQEFIAGSIACNLKKKYGVPFVLNVHGLQIYNGSLRGYFKDIISVNILKNCEYLLPVSEALGVHWDKAFSKRVSYKWKVIPNPVDPEIFRLPKDVRLSENKIIFFHVSKLTEMKDIPMLINAFAIAFKGKDAELRLAGGEKLQPDALEVINKFQINNQVFLLGAISQGQVAIEMQKCDVYLQSSPIETFGIPIVEAMMCGKPVVSTKSGGPDSIVETETGILVPPRDPIAFSSALERVASTLNHYDPIYIRNYAVKKYSINNVIKMMEHLYEDILKCQNSRCGVVK